MKKIFNHLILSSILPILFFINAAIPAYVFGCKTRGLIAVIFALLSALIALFSVIKALIIRNKSITDSQYWILSCVISAIPAVYIVIIAS